MEHREGCEAVRYYTIFAAVSALLCIATAWFVRPPISWNSAKGGRIVKVGFDTAPPLSEISAKGEPGGLAVALLQEAASRRNLKLQFLALPGLSPEEALESGIVDIWPALGASESRLKRFHLTKPWLKASFALVSKSSAGIYDPTDVIGKEVAFSGYQIATRVASIHLPHSVMQKMQPRSEVLLSVCTGKLAAGFEEASYLNTLILTSPTECAGIPLRVQMVTGATSPVSIAARRDAAGVADELRSALDDLASDGTMTLALNRWASFSVNETRSIFELRDAQDRRSRLLWGLAVVLLVLILLVWQVFRARQATRYAWRASEAKSEFLANMSHEIRTPMNGVLGMLDLVLEAPITEKQRGDLSIARDSAASLLAILTDVLDFSKIEAGRMEIIQAPFGPVACVAGVVRLFNISAQEKGLSLELISSDVPERVLGAELQFRQVVTNLVSNALKYTEKGGVRVELSGAMLSPEIGVLRIEVRDTGIGIPLELQAKVFSKFTQIDSSTRRRHGGTGLGLSIAKSFVDLMKGTIVLASTPGQGSSFRVEVPYTLPSFEEQAPVDEIPKVASPRQTVGTRVLVAEDNRVNQLVISRSLQSLGYAVDIAENGEQAIACCTATTYAAILMDCQMPIMDGYEATAAIRKSGNSNRSVPIIAVTAHASQGDEDRCRAAGMSDYLTKPISKESLRQVLLGLPGTS